ncbi:hypothetical protein F9B85_07065 [Heliorestis acidaminivorans]|uniref:G5 domain-containing protein n=1 Tax=Heliorestis acidaminivorans TaxID=553427 RepID=A0A6I0F1F3_9FIRM|nr:3D domain-containing protein [Heliorestis acidaminivorans]KAB2953017.1 hypothetical protein F9B85_07065 [Heliorestis acidaminivorans]
MIKEESKEEKRAPFSLSFRTGIFIVAVLFLTALFPYWTYGQQTKEVQLVLEGLASPYQSKAKSVKAFLREQDIDYGPQDMIIPDLAMPLENGMVVEVRKAEEVEIQVGNRSYNVMAYRPIEAGALKKNLAEQGIYVTAEDRVEPLQDDKIWEFVRVQRLIEKREEKIPYEQEVVLDSTLPAGETKISVPGKEGRLILEEEVILENGQLVERRIISEQLLTEPLNEVIVRGTGHQERRTTIASRGGTRELVNDEKIKSIEAMTGSSIAQTKHVESTAYTHTGNRTASGKWPRVGLVAVDPRVIPLGTKLYIEGYGLAEAADTGGAIKGNIIDVFFDTREECIQWGRRQVVIHILE